MNCPLCEKGIPKVSPLPTIQVTWRNQKLTMEVSKEVYQQLLAISPDLSGFKLADDTEFILDPLISAFNKSL